MDLSFNALMRSATTKKPRKNSTAADPAHTEARFESMAAARQQIVSEELQRDRIHALEDAVEASLDAHLSALPPRSDASGGELIFVHAAVLRERWATATRR